MRKKIFMPFIAGLSLTLFYCSFSFAYFGQVIKTFEAAGGAGPGKDWYGGLTWKDGYFCENLSRTDTIYVRNSSNGKVVQQISYNPHIRDCGIAWDGVG